MLTLLLGGARSGKSTLALQMAHRQPQPVTFIATAEPFDEDLAERIARHRDERPPHWRTVEAALELPDALRAVATDDFLIIDCLTVWLANLFVHLVEPESVAQYGHDLGEALRRRAGSPTVVVSNEVGMGVHPDSDLGRVYRDALGRLNQSVATIADRTLLLVAGRAVRLEDPWEFLQ